MRALMTNSTNISDNNEENNIRATQKADHRAPQVVDQKKCVHR